MMESVYVKELKHYSRSYLENLLSNNEKLLNKLLEYDIVRFNDNSYQLNYVGVIILENTVISCYPKYIKNEKNIERDFKQTLQVIKKYRSNESFRYENDELEDVSFNLLSVMIFFIEDYYENGVYSKIHNILETNGSGEINWDKTINDNFPIIKDSTPYYTELQTKCKINDLTDYFRLLHEYIITQCSKHLEKAGLLDLFNLTPADLNDLKLEDFGEIEAILNKLTKELNIEFNTHKQKLLKSMHTYLSQNNSFTRENYLTIYGTSSYHVIWEEICCKVIGDKLHKHLKNLKLPCKLNNKYNPNDELIAIIENPKWILNEGKIYTGKGTFIPDLVTFYDDNFIILDAKYYDIKFNENELSGQPELSSITKQFLYELAFKEFIELHKFKSVKNGFLFPSCDLDVTNKGCVDLKILSDLGLENIRVIMLPARKMNQLYLDNKKMDIEMLKL